MPRPMTGPTGTELVDHLAGIGIEEREAKLFVHLAMNGPSRASDAAAATRLKRTETYRALEALMKRGFVTAHLTRPVVYEAIAPDVLFTELLAGHEQRKSEIEELRERVITAVKVARKQNEAPGARHSYKIIQGRRPIYAALEAAIRSARGSLDMASTQLGAAAMTPKNRAWQTMLRRASEGMEMRFLLREDPALERALAPLDAHSNVQVRFFELDHALRLLLVDEREIIYWLVSDDSENLDAGGDVAMWTNAPDFLHAQAAFFETLWKDARPLGRPRG